MNSHTARSLSPLQKACSFISNQSFLTGLLRRGGCIAPIDSARNVLDKALRDAEVTG